MGMEILNLHVSSEHFDLVIGGREDFSVEFCDQISSKQNKGRQRSKK